MYYSTRMTKISKLQNLVDLGLKRTGLTAAEASLRATGNSQVIAGIKKGYMPSLDRWERLCKVLGIDFFYGFANESENIAEVRYLGIIAAGGGDHPEGTLVVGFEDIGHETTSAPAGLKPERLIRWGGLCALEVKGNSMSPKYNDGDMIYIYGDDPLKYSPERLIGKECAVYLGGDREGESYLKRLRWGDKRNQNLWNLESINLEWATMTNVEIIDIRPVRYQKVGGL